RARRRTRSASARAAGWRPTARCTGPLPSAGPARGGSAVARGWLADSFATLPALGEGAVVDAALVEQQALCLVPATQVADGEQVLHWREAFPHLGCHAIQNGPQAMLGVSALRFGCVQEVDERSSQLTRTVPVDVAVDEGDWILDENGGSGSHVVVALALGAPDEDLVFVGDDGVAAAAFEGQHRIAGPAIHDLH